MRYLRINHCSVPAAGGLNGPAPSHNDRTADPIFALSLTLIVMVMIYGCLSIFAAPVHTGIHAQNFFHSTNVAPLTMFWSWKSSKIGSCLFGATLFIQT